MANKKPIEYTVANWAYKTAKEIVSGKSTLTPEEFRKIINRQLEALQRLQTLATQAALVKAGDIKKVDQLHLDALKAWSKEETTPDTYKHHYRKNK